MSDINGWSLLTLLLVLFAMVALFVSTPETALVFAVNAVAVAVLSHHE